MAYSPDGRRIISGSADGCVLLWDAVSGDKLAGSYAERGGATSVCFSPDGRRYASGHTDLVKQVVYSPDGSQILTRSRDNTARLYNAQNGSLLAVISSRNEHLQRVEYSPEGRWINTWLSISDAKTAQAVNRLRIWDARTGREATLSHGFLWKTTCVCFSPNGRRIAAGATDNRVRVWDAHTGAKVAVFRGHKARINAVAYTPDSLMTYSDSDDKTVRVWDAKSGKCLEVKRGYLKLPKPTIEDPPPSLRPMSRGGDFGVELASEGRVIAWFPESLRPARPNGRTWVGWSVGPHY